MTKNDNRLFTALLDTCRSEFYRHAFPQHDSKQASTLGAGAFLSASLTRAEVAAKLLGFENDPKGAFEILGTTPSIVEGLKTHHKGEGPANLLVQLRKAQAHHLQHRDLERPVVKALGDYIDCRALPDLKKRQHEFGN
ncbi:MAG: hypothetical protein JWO78_801 [Micavibrio sp.]|nr:hypothetical protein [Micavibrio sp.]